MTNTPNITLMVVGPPDDEQLVQVLGRVIRISPATLAAWQRAYTERGEAPGLFAYWEGKATAISTFAVVVFLVASLVTLVCSPPGYVLWPAIPLFVLTFVCMIPTFLFMRKLNLAQMTETDQRYEEVLIKRRAILEGIGCDVDPKRLKLQSFSNEAFLLQPV